MSLVVGRLECIEASDSSDDIYMVVFRGNATPPFDSNVAVLGPGPEWLVLDDDGDHPDEYIRNADVTVAKWSPDMVHVVLVVDRDTNTDVAGAVILATWRARTDHAWKTAMQSSQGAGLSPTSEKAKKAGATAIVNELQALAGEYLDSDDLIDVKRVVVEPGAPETVYFISHEEDAAYKVTFKVV